MKNILNLLYLSVFNGNIEEIDRLLYHLNIFIVFKLKINDKTTIYLATSIKIS